MTDAVVHRCVIPPGQDPVVFERHLRTADRWYVRGDMRTYTMASIGVSQWQWHVQLGGRYVCGFWCIPDGPDGRGLVSMLFGSAADHLPLRAWCKQPRAEWRRVLASGAYPSLRAWVACEDARAKRFAQFMGFAYDCGPATGYLPDGKDADLYIWRHGNGQGRFG